MCMHTDPRTSPWPAHAEYGYFNDIGCVAATCFAISECPDTQCSGTNYGMHIWRSTDGGDSWEESYNGYEESALVRVDVSISSHPHADVHPYARFN